MEPLDQNRSIDAHKPNHTTKVQNISIPHGSILERLSIYVVSMSAKDTVRTVNGEVGNITQLSAQNQQD